MRKLISLILLLTLLCSLGACGKKAGGTTSENNSEVNATQDLLIYQSMELAATLGKAVEENYGAAMKLSGDALVMAGMYVAAAMPESVDAVSIMQADNFDPETAINTAYSKLDSTTAQTCTYTLSFTCRFRTDMALNGTAVYLRYGQDCHILVVYSTRQNGMTTATVYPLSASCADVLLSTYLTNATSFSAEDARQRYQQMQGASLASNPTGATCSAKYYTQMAKDLLVVASQPSKATISQHIQDEALANQMYNMSQHLKNAPAASALFDFPDLEAKLVRFTDADAKALYRQMLYLTWGQYVCQSLGDDCVTINTVMNRVLKPDAPGIAAEAGETPIMVLLDYHVCTVLVTFYANENNIYEFNYTYLACDYETACAALTALGAIPK